MGGEINVSTVTVQIKRGHRVGYCTQRHISPPPRWDSYAGDRTHTPLFWGKKIQKGGRRQKQSRAYF